VETLTTKSEPKGKLDTMATQQAAMLAAVAVVNGPEDELLDWHAIRWRAAEEDVRRLRQRIFTASQVGDLKRVRSLQKLMLRSRANTLLSVRRVTELNAGRATAGVDGKVVLLAESKALLVDRVQHHTGPWQARPVKRVYIPKKGSAGKRRPLGIPVILDRVLQARVVNALEPEWEARFEPRSYGFRPGRGCHDAIGAIFNVARGASPRRRWVLDADLAGAFDRIDHDHLLGMLGMFPARGLIADWLKAGVVEQGRFAPTEEGTPQGGVVSPLLLNVALHGMEQAAGVRYRQTGVHAGDAVQGSTVLIRYADLCRAQHKSAYADRRIMPRLAG
jgi:RNA-directed DNA polymerase